MHLMDFPGLEKTCSSELENGASTGDIVWENWSSNYMNAGHININYSIMFPIKFGRIHSSN